MSIIQQLKNCDSQINQAIGNIFNQKQLEKLARKTGFIQRSTSKITGSNFLELMTTEIIQEPKISYEGLCDRLRTINPEANITPQAIEQRINSEGAVKYLEETLKISIKENLKSQYKENEFSLLSNFKNVFLEDSTQGVLNEKLANTFKGSGGSASKAGLKVDLVYELKQNAIHELILTNGATSDQSHSGTFLENLQENDLILRDLGYFKNQSFIEIEAKNAFYLSRLLSQVNVYLTPNSDISIDLPKYIKTTYAKNNLIDITVYIGKNDKFKTRLIVYKPSQEIIKIRKSKAKKKAAKKGRVLTQKSLDWLEFSFFITNVPVTIWSAKVVGTIYRLRWQIELIFKNWKSLLNIDILKGTRNERIKCLIYGRLIGVVMITMLCSFASIIAKIAFQREISFHKVIQWLLRKERLANAIHNNLLSSLLFDLNIDILKLCKQKRKRQTTEELIQNQIDYPNSFEVPLILPIEGLA